MNAKLNEDLGENYQYIKTIAKNKIELAKLEVIDNIADLGSLLLIGTVAMLLSFVTILTLLAAIAYLLIQVTGSVILTCTIIGTTFIILLILLLIFREKVVITPFSNFIYKKLVKS